MLLRCVSLPLRLLCSLICPIILLTLNRETDDTLQGTVTPYNEGRWVIQDEYGLFLSLAFCISLFLSRYVVLSLCSAVFCLIITPDPCAYLHSICVLIYSLTLLYYYYYYNYHHLWPPSSSVAHHLILLLFRFFSAASNCGMISGACVLIVR